MGESDAGLRPAFEGGTAEYLTPRLWLAVPDPTHFAGWEAAHAAAGPARDRFDIAARPPAERTPAHFEALLAALAHRRACERPVWFVIRRRDGLLAGTVTLFDIARGDSQSGFVGYHIFNHLRGHGLATEAVEAVVRIAFAPCAVGGLGLHRIEACIEPENVGSRRVVEKCGFRYEGLSRRRILRGATWRDVQVWAMTIEERGGSWRSPDDEAVDGCAADNAEERAG